MEKVSYNTIKFKEIKEYYWGAVKEYIFVAVYIPLVFAVLYILAFRGGPMMDFAPLSMEERLCAAGFPALMISFIPFFAAIKYYRLIKSIVTKTKEDQAKVFLSFDKSISVFKGEARIGRDYTFVKKEVALFTTKEIRHFRAEKKRVRGMPYLSINMVMDNAEIGILLLKAKDDGEREAAELIREAIGVLKALKENTDTLEITY